MSEYSHEPDDGHRHNFVAEPDLPDTGTDATTMICTKCGLLTAEVLEGETAAEAMKYKVTYAFNVRRFLKKEIEAETTAEAMKLAREQASEQIYGDLEWIESVDGFGTVAVLDPFLILDTEDGAVILEEEIEGIDEP